MFSGVRPSSGAATLGHYLAFEFFSTLENAELAVAEDGHTPLNRYESLGYLRSSLWDFIELR